MSPTPYTRMLNSAYIKLCIIELLIQMGMQMVQPVVSNAALALGASITIAGILAGLSTAVSMSLRIVSGRVISSIAPKKVLVASTAILMVSTLLFATFYTIPTLAISRALYGVGMVVKTVIVVTVCVRVVPKDSIGQAVAWIGMANVFSVAVGPTLAQFIGLNFGYNTTFFVNAALFTIATILCLTFPNVPLVDEENVDEKPAAADSAAAVETAGEVADANDAAVAPDATGTASAAATPAQQPATGIARLWKYIYYDALPLALVGVLEGIIFGIVNTLTLTVSQLRDMPEISMFFLVYVIVSFCMRPVIGKLYDKLGFEKLGPIMCFLMGLSMFTFAFTDGLVMVIVDGALFALGQGCLWPCLQAESVRNVPMEKGSLSTNTLLFGVDIGIMLGPMIGGRILDVAGPMWMYLFGAAVGLFLTLWTLQYVRIVRRRESAQSNAIQTETIPKKTA